MKASQLKMGINGFGRIGHLIFRLGCEKLSIVAVNGRNESKMAAHLLQYDSIHGLWNKKISCFESTLQVEDQTIAWYDNETDFSSRVIDFIYFIENII